MSKRFGRQQKRKFRSELSELRAANKTLETRNKNLIELNETLNDIVSAVHEIFGKHFVLLPAEKAGGYSDYLNKFCLPLWGRNPVDINTLYDAASNVTKKMFDIMRFNIEEGFDPLHLKEMVHIHVTYVDKSIAWAVDKKALPTLPVQIIAREIAACIKGWYQ